MPTLYFRVWREPSGQALEKNYSWFRLSEGRVDERAATVSALLTVGFAHARSPSGNRTLSIGMGHDASATRGLHPTQRWWCAGAKGRRRNRFTDSARWCSSRSARSGPA
jgi:hypothetical protein